VGAGGLGVIAKIAGLRLRDLVREAAP
jgi:hypothetical protein